MAVSAELRRQLDEARAANAHLDDMTDEQWNAHAASERAEREQVRTMETLATLGVGCEVWAKPVVAEDAVGALRGGLCVAVTELADPGTGEIRRAFQTAKWHHGRQLRFEIIGEADVDAWRCKPPNGADVRAFIRKCTGEITRSSGVFTTEILDYYEIAGRLIRAVILPGGAS